MHYLVHLPLSLLTQSYWHDEQKSINIQLSFFAPAHQWSEFREDIFRQSTASINSNHIYASY